MTFFVGLAFSGMRCGCFGLMIVLALLWGGGQSVYTSVKNREITEVSIEDLISGKTDAAWLRITGGEMSIVDSAYTATIGTDNPDEMYVPVFPKGADTDTDLVHVLYQTKEPEFMSILNRLKGLGDAEGDIQKAMEIMVEARELEVRPVEGLVQFGIESDSNDDKVKRLFDNLSDDCVIVAANEKPPAIWVGLLMCGVAIVILFVILASVKTGKNEGA